LAKSETADILKRIDVRIAELGMSKEEFYEKSGISSASYSQWNTGAHAPTKKKLAQAAAALGVSVEYILTGNENKPTTTGELDKDTMELLDLAHSLGEDDRALLLSMARELKKRNIK